MLRNNSIVVFAFTCALLSSACSKNVGSLVASEVPAGIIGGSAPAPGDSISRSTVAVYGTYSGRICTGVIVSPTVVLTASYCVRDQGPDVAVVFAPYILSPTLKAKSVRKAEKIVFHSKSLESWEEISASYPALIQIKDIPEGYAPIELTSSDPRVGDRISVAGYGLKPAGTLQKAKVTVVNTRYTDGGAILSQGSTATCYGDGGGAALIEDGEKLKVWAIAGYALNDPSRACVGGAVYLRAAAFADWLKRELRVL